MGTSGQVGDSGPGQVPPLPGMKGRALGENVGGRVWREKGGWVGGWVSVCVCVWGGGSVG